MVLEAWNLIKKLFVHLSVTFYSELVCHFLDNVFKLALQ